MSSDHQRHEPESPWTTTTSRPVPVTRRRAGRPSTSTCLNSTVLILHPPDGVGRWLNPGYGDP
jgi:hypothetical protein